MKEPGEPKPKMRFKVNKQQPRAVVHKSSHREDIDRSLTFLSQEAKAPSVGGYVEHESREVLRIF